MDSSVSGKDEIWFLRMCHQVPSWGSLGVVLLLWYVGPTVGGWGRISPTCGAKNMSCKRSIGGSRWLVWRLWGNMIFVLKCVWSRVCYRVPDSAVCISWGEMKGPILLAFLVAVVYCPKLVVMNTIISLCGFPRTVLHILRIEDLNKRRWELWISQKIAFIVMWVINAGLPVHYSAWAPASPAVSDTRQFVVLEIFSVALCGCCTICTPALVV